jgi:PAS domain S-box-containing protein
VHVIFSSIRSRIIGLLLALALPLVAIVAFALWREYRTSAERAEGAAVELAVATANGVQHALDGGHAVVESLAGDPAILALDAPGCAPWLREVTGMLPQFANIVVADAEGTVVCSALTMPDERPTVAARPWFQAVRATAAPATGSYQVGNITGRAVTVVAHPLIGEVGEFLGVVAAGIDLSQYQGLLEGLPQPPGAVVTLADDEWTVLARSTEPARWIGQTLPGDTVPERAVAPGVGIFKATGLDEIDRVFGFATVRGPNWRVYAGVPETWIYAPVRAAAIRRGIAISAVLVAVAVLTLLLFRLVARSLTALVEGTRAAAGGEGARVPETGPREVVAVGRQFNATLAARDRAERALRRARERYASVVRNAPAGIYVGTAQGRFIDVNPALVRMLGYPDEGALRRVRIRDMFTDPEQFDALVARALDGEDLPRIEAEWRRFDGGVVLVDLSCATVVLADGERVIEVIAEDVTERRALEHHLLETRKMEAIGRLAGGVAHDFNNLLTIVRGQAQFLLFELGEDSAASEHAREIVEATQRGARLTRQLLAFGRRQVVQPMALELNGIVRNLQSMLQRVIGTDIRLMLHLADPLPPVLSDPGQIEQIVMNLVFNARDAMPDGGDLIITTVGAELSESDCRGRAGACPGNFVVLSVEDTGQGIPPDLMDRVFEPFFTTKPQGHGTGLGLATVYGIVSQSGGWIEVESRVARGTRFTVFLPQATEAPEPLPELVEVGGDGGEGTVLVVEDEDAVRRVVTTALRQRGYDVFEAANGEEALRVASEIGSDLDLVVTDEMMPGMRGTQLAHTLAERRPDSRVLFMSGYADNVPAGSTFDGMPSAFLPKPFSHEQLLSEVSKLLRRAAQPPQDRAKTGAE